MEFRFILIFAVPHPGNGACDPNYHAEKPLILVQTKKVKI